MKKGILIGISMKTISESDTFEVKHLIVNFLQLTNNNL